MKRLAAIAGGVIVAVIAVVAVGGALVQTGPGRAWLAAAIGAALSDPNDKITLSGLQGIVPFDLRVGAIVISDQAGPRLSVSDTHIAISARDLLAGRLTIRALTIGRVAVLRPGASASTGTTDWTTLLHPKLPVALDRLEIGALALDKPVLGTAMTLAVSGSGAVGAGRAQASLALRRIDGTPGTATLKLAYGGAAPHLTLSAEVSEPDGTVLAGLLGRREPLPLTLEITGDGPLADWQGELNATAGSDAALRAKFRIAGNAPYRLTVTGEAQAAALLPPQARAAAGDRTTLAAEIALSPANITLDRLSITAAGFGLEAQGRYVEANGTIAATAHLALPDLARLLPELAGAGTVDLALGGKLPQPDASASLTVTNLRTDAIAADRATASLRVEPEGELSAARAHVVASGHVEGLTLAATPVPAGLGDALDWRIDGRIDPPAATAARGTVEITDRGVALTATLGGNLAGAAGEIRLAVPDLVPLDGGMLAGALDLTTEFHAARDGSGTAVLAGAIAAPKSTQARLDTLIGKSLAIAGTIERSADGTITAKDITAAGGAFKLTGAGERVGQGTLAADFDLALARLSALDPRVTGAATLAGHIAGAPDALAGTLTLAAPQMTVAALRIAGLQANLALTGSAPLAGRLTARFRANGIDTTLSANGVRSNDAIRVSDIAIAAAGARLDGALDWANGRAEGRLHGRIPDLRPWSGMAGVPLTGRAELDARVAGNRYTATLDASDLAMGGASPARAQHVAFSADLTDPFGRPTGQASLALGDAAAGSAVVGAARLGAKSDRAGHFALTANAHGTVGETFTMSTAAGLGLGPGAAVALTVSRLGGTIGARPYSLGAPLALAWRDGTVKFSGLKLAVGPGSVSGDGTLGPKALALRLSLRTLPVQDLAHLAGVDAAGRLGLDLTLGGTRAAPQGHLELDGENLRFAAASRPDLPAFGAVAEADWRDGRVTMKGRLAGPEHAAIGWTASVPLVLERGAMALDVPRAGTVAAHLEGAGELGAFADLLPDAEDRITGHFTVNVSVAGTVADPAASGSIGVAGGRYESFATGAILTGVHFTLMGERDRLVLRDFAASDGFGGSVAVIGAVDLAATGGPTLALTATLKRLRALNRDQAKATASGELRVSGSIAAPRVDATVTIEEADLAVPELPAAAARPVAAQIIDSASGKTLSAATVQQGPALMAATLNITVTLPGQTFVRGRGLDSEWRGRLVVSGTPAAPSITGRLDVVRGTYDLVGKTFVLSQGTITFLGGRTIDPIINIQATAQSSDITAMVALTGTATQPTIKLTSSPALPNDEILARLLFGTSMSQIGPAQGVEIASAAASLAGGDALDVLGKLRRGLGLDRLGLGSAPGSVVPGIGVPALSSASGPATGFGATPLAPGTSSGALAGGTALNAGKYVANGVYVGVSQGLQPGSSTANVTIDVTRHISVDTEAGQMSGAGIGIGVNWKLDY